MSSMAFETKQEMDVVTAFFVPAGSFPSFSDFVRAGEAVSSSSAAAIQPETLAREGRALTRQRSCRRAIGA